MFCVSCRKYDSDRGSRFVVGTSNFRIDTLKQHDASKAHISCQLKNEVDLAKRGTSGTVFCSYTGQATHDTSMTESSGASASNQPAVIGPMDISICKLNEGQRQKLIACFNTAYFIAKQELPFTIYPNLLDLQERNGVSLPTSYKTDQACRRFMKYIFDDVMTENHKLLKKSRVLSIMFDGATDVSICENELVYARVVVAGVPTHIYIKNQDVEHAHALGVKQAIEKAMDSLDEQGWDWKAKLVATGSDGASVNLGKNHSVTSLLKDEIPHLIAVHCVCHRLELGALDAMKDRESKLFLDLKSVLIHLHKHYHYSAKALRELQMLAEAMEEKMLRPVNLEGTRWMPHLSGSLAVLLKKYNIFVAHFENVVAAKTGSADVQGRAKNVLKHLKDRRLLHFMHFLKDILTILSDLSLQFQKDSNTIPDAVLALETACLSLIALQHRPGENLQNFIDNVDDNDQFKGVKLSALAVTPEQIKNTEDGLIDSVIKHISKRIGSIDSNELMKDMQIFYPVNLPETDNERVVYGEHQLRALCEYFSPALQRLECDINRLQQTEWPALKVHMHQQAAGIGAQLMYQRLFTDPNLSVNFQNILMLVEIILCIPISSAVCERGFSAMARIKSDWRSRLSPEMLSYLMGISIAGPDTNVYNAQRAFALWWHGGARNRRPEFGDDE